MDSSDAAARVVERYEAMELNAVDTREAFREAVEGAEENDLESARDRLVELLGTASTGRGRQSRISSPFSPRRGR